MTYRWLPHTADIRTQIQAPTLQGVLAEATAVVRELLVGQSPVAPRVERAITAAGADEAELVLAFTRALFEQYHRDGFVPGIAEPGEPSRRGGGLDVVATIRGEQFDPSRHEPQPEVKAVTRHGLRVERTEQGWTADVLFDV